MRKLTSDLKKWILVLICVFSVAAFLPSQSAEAASTKTKALKAYAKMLSKKTIKRTGHTTMQTKNCKFAIAYIDNNSVPELVIYNDTDLCHAEGFGALYTYKNGKVVYVTSLFLDGKSRLGYYKKTGWFMDNVTWQGYGTDSFYKLSGKKVKSDYVLFRDRENGKSVAFGLMISNNYQTVDATTFNRVLSTNTKSKKLTKFKFYNNTAKNRKKYLK